MTFDDQVPDTVQEVDPSTVEKVPVMVSTGLEDILERIEAAKRQKDETEMAKLVDKTAEKGQPAILAHE